MSEHARELIKANNLEHVVEVIEESMEDVVLPEKGLFFSFKMLSFCTFFFSLPVSKFFHFVCSRCNNFRMDGILSST